MFRYFGEFYIVYYRSPTFRLSHQHFKVYYSVTLTVSNNDEPIKFCSGLVFIRDFKKLCWIFGDIEYDLVQFHLKNCYAA